MSDRSVSHYCVHWSSEFRLPQYPFWPDSRSVICSFGCDHPGLAKENSFTTGRGCKSFKQDSIEAHQKSAAHHACAAAIDTKENPDATPTARSLSQMSDDMFIRMIVLFNTVYYVAKEEKPFSDFGPLLIWAFRARTVYRLGAVRQPKSLQKFHRCDRSSCNNGSVWMSLRSNRWWSTRLAMLQSRKIAVCTFASLIRKHAKRSPSSWRRLSWQEQKQEIIWKQCRAMLKTPITSIKNWLV